MKIGDETVDDLEIIGWIDKLVGPALSRLCPALGCHIGFQCADHTGPHGDHTVAALLAVVDRLGRFSGDVVILRSSESTRRIEILSSL